MDLAAPPMTDNPFDYDPPIVGRHLVYEPDPVSPLKSIVVADNPVPPCPLNQGDLATLRWKASLLEHDTGRRIRVIETVLPSAPPDITYRARYEVSTGSSVAGPYSVEEMMAYLDGYSTSYHEGRDRGF
jgi:hypothetical protein